MEWRERVLQVRWDESGGQKRSLKDDGRVEKRLTATATTLLPLSL
jgi:hypothetical protein